MKKGSMEFEEKFPKLCEKEKVVSWYNYLKIKTYNHSGDTFLIESDKLDDLDHHWVNLNDIEQHCLSKQKLKQILAEISNWGCCNCELGAEIATKISKELKLEENENERKINKI